MSLAKLMALTSLLPAAALAQGPAAPIDAAKQAAQKAQAGIERREALVEQASPPEGTEPPPDQPGEGVDLGRAAERLEGLAPEEPAAPGQAAPAAGAAQPPDTYTVKPGDTLWDLSGRFLNNPWYWPKVWSYNPEITNPHWIYPGNVVRFYPSGEEAPARVEPVAEAPPAEEEPVAGPRELEDLSRGRIDKMEQLGEDDAVAVAGPYRVGHVPTKPAPVRRDSFLTRRQLEESGRIVASFEEKRLLSHLDKVYARFRDPQSVKVGEAYAIYRSEGPVRHPRSGEVVGYKTLILGQGKVTRIDERAATLIITASYDTIERGDYLGPWSERLVKPVQVRPNQATLEGFIVATHPSILTMLGEYNVVYLDKGKADGVEEGNTFRVIRSGDPLGLPAVGPRFVRNLPPEVVGTLLVYDVKEHVSSALVMRSLFELAVGDRIEMRPGATAAGSGGS